MRILSPGALGRLTPAVLLAVLVTCLLPAGATAASILGFESFTAGGLNADGSPSAQAGAHPFELTTSFALGTITDPDYGVLPDAALKETVVEIPAGAIGNPQAVPQCRESTLQTVSENCPSNTQVGYADVDRMFFGRGIQRSPVYNVVPGPGEAAAFRFTVTASVVHIDVRVRSDGDYGVNATATGINSAAPVFGVAFHLWGVPADSSHDADRGGPSGMPLRPFLRNPTSCTGPMTTVLHATSWSEPERVVTASAKAPAMTGCAAVPFAPTISVAPDTKSAGSPAGFGIDVNVSQRENPEGLATSDVKDVEMTLPAGVAINPAAANGLAGCTDAQLSASSPTEGSCPDASKLGAVEIKTPLLAAPLKGSLFLGTPLEQGAAAAASGRMFRVFLEAQGVGTRITRVGTVVPDPATGRLTVTFANNPQLPFETLHVQLYGGAQAALTTPRLCGVYTTRAKLTPWARPSEPVEADSSFTIDENCGNASSFTPSLEAGTIGNAAGASSPFTMTLNRPDGQQDLNSIALSLPPGLVANIANVPLCPEAQAATGGCSTVSQIGRTSVAAGAGPAPLWVPLAGRTPTAVFLAGPYGGAPFSLSVVVPAQAGPFDLGTVVVRAALFIDRHDAHVSAVSDAIPTILDGVPLNVQKINVTVDRPGFMVSPTSCAASQITGMVASSAGQTARVASGFQVRDCGALRFTPKFAPSVATGTARIKGKVRASKANGVALHVKLAYPPGSRGTQTNIARVKVELPKQLPSRVSTLQKACTSAQFAANPASCPAASVVGNAKVITPLLPVALTGPAYLVSHGGEAFPALIMVLQGDGVTIELLGTTFISKAGITSSTFASVPDVPFSSFDLTLPKGRYSLLAGNGDLCHPRLAMPTDYLAQSGIRLHQNNVISVAGCKSSNARTAHRKH